MKKKELTICCAIILFNSFSFCCAIDYQPVIEMRWDFTDCKQIGRFGPTQKQCDEAYADTNLEGDVKVEYGVQTWSVPMSGLFLITARGASGLSVAGRNGGRGAVTTSEFRLKAGEQLKILVGQKSDYDANSVSFIGPGGSGGTFITRVSDGYVLMVAGGGSSSAGRIPDLSRRQAADASLTENAKNASAINGNYGTGGKDGLGGFRGFITNSQISTSGGGAGFYENGNHSYVKAEEFKLLESPSPSIRYNSDGVSDRGPGVGGFLMFFFGSVTSNNGGFGGGGSGSLDGGAGGGGGYSGGGGGPWNGWGGGGGSVNNGKSFIPVTLHSGKGSVTITFTGFSCCGPFVVYAAASFIGGLIVAVFCIYGVVRLNKYFIQQEKKSSNKNPIIFSEFFNKRGPKSPEYQQSGHENLGFEDSSVVERKDLYWPRQKLHD